MSNLTDWGLSDNYTDPSTISAFFKIGNKESYDIRIVGSFSDPCTGVQGWEAWKDTVNEQGADVRVPERVGIKDKALLNRKGYPDKEIKFFWALAVYNRSADCIQCWQINQVTIRRQLETLLKHRAWGVPNRYDINASREGEGYDTEYTLNALPAEDGSGLGPCPVAQQALEESTIDLRQLFVGGDIMTPLEEKTPDASEKPRVERSDLKPLELVRNAIESATSYELLDEARMLKDSYVKRGDISKAEQMTLVSLEAKVKERLQEVA
tara:strand:- start:7 stop:807 length:801 start_codon:yes stop_codon:yes gene_type:complete